MRINISRVNVLSQTKKQLAILDVLRLKHHIYIYSLNVYKLTNILQPCVRNLDVILNDRYDNPLVQCDGCIYLSQSPGYGYYITFPMFMFDQNLGQFEQRESCKYLRYNTYMQYSSAE